ncbi:winged helix-turn-helix transcriptional regulator [Halorubrum gandharaense]
MADSESGGTPEVLDSKRDATRYQVLVEIAARQPAVSQSEIAEAIGVTSQAVSDYVRDLVEAGYVDKGGRGRYEVTKEGVDWLISRTDSLETYLERVSSDVLGSVEVDAAVALDDVSEGEEVGLLMRDGVLHATTAGGSATAVAVTSARTGEALGVTDFEGVVDYDTGTVVVLPVPSVTDANPPAPETVTNHLPDDGLLAVAGTEAYALVSRSDADVDLRFGTADGVTEAALRGLDVLLVATTDELPRHTNKLREENVPHKVLDPADR